MTERAQTPQMRGNPAAVAQNGGTGDGRLSPDDQAPPRSKVRGWSSRRRPLMAGVTLVALALAWLAEVRGAVPREHRARHDLLEVACHALDYCEDLLPVLIHNDCHPGNSLRTADGRVVLIDWEGAGLGPAVIDVGFLLVSCEIEAFRLNRLPPDPARVHAIVDGYCRHSSLTAAALNRFADAIRFRAIIAAASGFRRMIVERLTDDPSAWAWARYDAADEIAARAGARFERYST